MNDLFVATATDVDVGVSPARSRGPKDRTDIKHCPRILSLDGGGVRGLSSLLILREIMEEIGRRTKAAETPLPCECFDLIGGTSTGGLIAIMLGRLGMVASYEGSVDECIKEYVDLSKDVFEIDKVLKGIVPVGDNQCRFDYNKLESAIQAVVKKKLKTENPNIPMADMAEIPVTVPTFVVATKGLNAGGPPTLFRSYQCEGHNADKCYIWQAACATSAAPTFFKPATIEVPPPKATYVDGGLQNNNPAQLAIFEARKIWTKAIHFTVVSVGTGRLKAVQITDPQANASSKASRKAKVLKWIPGATTASRIPAGLQEVKKMAQACVDLVTNSEPAHQRLLEESTSTDPAKKFPYYRFNVERDMQDIGLEEWNKVEEMNTHTKVYMEERERVLVKNECVRALMNPPVMELIKEPSKPVPKHFMVSYQRNAHFTGREELLSELRHRLVETKQKQFNHRIAIYGLGGVGKTQVAIEYVYRYQSEYYSIFWITAADEAALLSGYEDIAKTTGCVPTINTTPDVVAKGVMSWLRTQETWLLVLDNLDDISIVEGYLPETAKGGHTLITTRNPDYLQFPAEGIEIPLLGKDEAVELLRLRSSMQSSEFTPEQTVQASDIVNELGYLALAIEQASAFIRVSLKDISEFLPIYKDSQKSLLDRKAPGIRYPTSLYATVLLSFKKVQQMKYGQQAMKLLHLMAFLNPDGILIEFLKEGGAGLSDELREITTDQFIFHEALNSLQQLSLVSRSKKMDSIIVHRLIQAVTKEELSEAVQKTYQSEVLALCQTVIPHYSHELYLKFKRLQSQIVEPVFGVCAVMWAPESEVLLDLIGVYLMDDGKYKDAQRFHELNLDRRISLRGEEDLDTIASFLSLANVYWHQARLPEAADLEEKVLEAQRRILGEEHPDTLGTMINLASTYRDQGQIQEAADLEEKVLEAMRRILGEEHRDTLILMNNLALTYSVQGRLQEAADMGEKVLEAWRRILGKEHPDTLTTMNNLASTYREQGRLREAAGLEEKVWEASRRILGEEHPATLKAMGNLASTYQLQGRLQEAANLEEKALEAMGKTLGEEHPHTLASMSNLASTYWRQGRLQGAAGLEEKVLEAQRRILGEEHPDTLLSMNNLALSYSHLGRMDDAITLMQKAVDGRQRILGSEHEYTRGSKDSLDEWLGLLLRQEKRLIHRITRTFAKFAVAAAAAAAAVIPTCNPAER